MCLNRLLYSNIFAFLSAFLRGCGVLVRDLGLRMGWWGLWDAWKCPWVPVSLYQGDHGVVCLLKCDSSSTRDQSNLSWCSSQQKPLKSLFLTPVICTKSSFEVQVWHQTKSFRLNSFLTGVLLLYSDLAWADYNSI